MGQADGPAQGRTVRNAAPPRSKGKPKVRQPMMFSRGWWRRLPMRQRQRFLRLGVWIFLVLFVASVAGGLFLASLSSQTVNNGAPAATPTSTAPQR